MKPQFVIVDRYALYGDYGYELLLFDHKGEKLPPIWIRYEEEVKRLKKEFTKKYMACMKLTAKTGTPHAVVLAWTENDRTGFFLTTDMTDLNKTYLFIA